MKFISTEFGFVKSIEFDKVELKFKIQYTMHLFEALQFAHTKTAVGAMNKAKIKGFVYGPYIEVPISPTEKLFEVVRRREYYSFNNDEKHEVLEYFPERMFNCVQTDEKFVTKRNTEIKLFKFFPLKDAIKLSIEKNSEMLKELKRKIAAQKKQLKLLG
jgi:hypothetical protein